MQQPHPIELFIADSAEDIINGWIMHLFVLPANANFSNKSALIEYVEGYFNNCASDPGLHIPTTPDYSRTAILYAIMVLTLETINKLDFTAASDKDSIEPLRQQIRSTIRDQHILRLLSSIPETITTPKYTFEIKKSLHPQ